MKDYFRGALHALLIVALIGAPAYILGQNATTGRDYAAWNVPSGAGFIIFSGSCPAGSTEVTALDAAMPLGTLAAHGDIGGTGGANAITPAGTNGSTTVTPTGTVQQASFTGASGTTSAVSAGTPAGTNGTVTGPAPTVSWPAGVPTLAMNSYTPAGSNGTVTGPAQVVSWPAGVPTISGTTINSFSSVINHTHTITVTSLVQGGTTAATTGTHIMTSTATGGSARAPTSGDSFTATSANPAGGVASITPTINAPGTIAWPGGVPTNATSTIPAETFTGTPATLTGVNSWPAGVPTNSTTTIPAETFTGSPLGTHTHTLTPSGTINAQAFSGDVNTVPAEAFSGTQFDNRSAYVKVIYCQRT